MRIVRRGRGRCQLEQQPLPSEVSVALGRPIDLDTASQQDLQILPGIGPARARAIVTYRTDQGGIERLEDLQRIEGIGPKTVARLRGLVRCGDDVTPR